MEEEQERGGERERYIIKFKTRWDRKKEKGGGDNEKKTSKQLALCRAFNKPPFLIWIEEREEEQERGERWSR